MRFVFMFIVLLLFSCKGKEPVKEGREVECYKRLRYVEFCLKQEIEHAGQIVKNLTLQSKTKTLSLKESIGNGNKSLVLLFLSPLYCDTCNKEIYDYFRESFVAR